MELNTDARNLKHDQLTELRKRAVAAVQNGESPEDVARIFGVSRTAIYNWLAKYRNGGWHQLDAKKRGGRKPKLDAKSMRWIYRVISQNDPRQYKFSFALWSSKIVGELIHRKLGIRLSKASVCRLLNQLGLSAQRPLWRAYQRDPDRVDEWLKNEYPAIRAKAKRQKAEIWFSDEAGVRSDSHSGTTWAPKGLTPVATTTGARFGINVISAVSPAGSLRFMCVEGRVNAGVFIEFLKRLIHDSPKKIFLIVDGHPSHKAKKVQRFVESVSDQLELYFLPPYSPDLNPDELVWNDMKNNAVRRTPFSDKKDLKKVVSSFLRSIQKMPERIRSYFQAPSTTYAMY